MAATGIFSKSAVPNRLGASLLLCLSSTGLGLGEESTDGSTCVSRSGLYHVSYTSDLEPTAINRIHTWVLHVETADGEPIAGAEVMVDGGMPEHDHGLPTSPRQTQELGGGDYLVEGMRFHMNGRWEIVITVSAHARSDTCALSLTL